MLKVTLRQLRLGKTKSFTECLSMEYNIAQQVITDPTSDFFTGVESLLINKSKAIWDKSFSELESITESSIDKYFTSKLELEFSCNKTFYEYPHTTLSYPREIDILNVIESKNVFKKRGDVFRKRQDVVDWFCNYWGYYSSDAIGIDDGDLTRVFDRSKTDNVSKKVGLRERVEFLVGGWKEGDAGLFKGDKI